MPIWLTTIIVELLKWGLSKIGGLALTTLKIEQAVNKEKSQLEKENKVIREISDNIYGLEKTRDGLQLNTKERKNVETSIKDLESKLKEAILRKSGRIP